MCIELAICLFRTRARIDEADIEFGPDEHRTSERDAIPVGRMESLRQDSRAMRCVDNGWCDDDVADILSPDLMDYGTLRAGMDYVNGVCVDVTVCTDFSSIQCSNMNEFSIILVFMGVDEPD